MKLNKGFEALFYGDYLFIYLLKRSYRPRIFLGFEHGERCPDKSVEANAGVPSGHIKVGS